ncbi:hypothetical protein ACFW6U_24495, partial [Pseudomonas guariconensis]|uniref:hypothetical protein n=1 Tax=Pseudomonas guariconensis TaxID=1288410 RepID=UPI00366EF351
MNTPRFQEQGNHPKHMPQGQTDRNYQRHARKNRMIILNRPCFPRHSPSSENSVSHTLLATAA